LASASIVPATVSVTELGYIDGVTSAIQTQMDTKAATSAAINPTIVDAKGDLIAATAADAVSRIAIGANDTVLTADSAQATGMKWAAAGGGMTLISTTAITATASVDLTSIPSTYKDLIIVIDGVYENTGSSQVMTFNNATTLYSSAYILAQSANTVAVVTSGSSIPLAQALRFVAGSGSGSVVIRIPNYASTTMAKLAYVNSYGSAGAGSTAGARGAIDAITSVKITWAGIPTAQGNVLLYGVN
jgi:hypothetical protein